VASGGWISRAGLAGGRWASGDSDQSAGSSWDSAGDESGQGRGAASLINRGNSLLRSQDSAGCLVWPSGVGPGGRDLLADLLERNGDLSGAREAYESVISSGHPELAPAAGIWLGLLFARLGDLAEARRGYELAIGPFAAARVWSYEVLAVPSGRLVVVTLSPAV
jgi:hypothetical protein